MIKAGLNQTPPFLVCHRLFWTQPRIPCCLEFLCPSFVQLLTVPLSLLISHESDTLGGAGELFYRRSLNLSDGFALRGAFQAGIL